MSTGDIHLGRTLISKETGNDETWQNLAGTLVNIIKKSQRGLDYEQDNHAKIDETRQYFATEASTVLKEGSMYVSVSMIYHATTIIPPVGCAPQQKVFAQEDSVLLKYWSIKITRPRKIVGKKLQRRFAQYAYHKVSGDEAQPNDAALTR